MASDSRLPSRSVEFAAFAAQSAGAYAFGFAVYFAAWMAASPPPVPSQVPQPPVPHSDAGVDAAPPTPDASLDSTPPPDAIRKSDAIRNSDAIREPARRRPRPNLRFGCAIRSPDGASTSIDVWAADSRAACRICRARGQAVDIVRVDHGIDEWECE